MSSPWEWCVGPASLRGKSTSHWPFSLKHLSYSPAPTISEFSSEVSVPVSSFPSPPSTREAENLRGRESGSGSVRRIRALTALGQRLPERASSEPLRPHPAHTSRDSRPSLGHTGVNRVFCFASHLVGVAPQTGRRTNYPSRRANRSPIQPKSLPNDYLEVRAS